MTEALKIFSRRALQTLFEGLAVLALILVLSVGILVWRLSASPLDIGFAKDYIEGTLRDHERGLSAQIDGLALHWPKLDGPLLLGVRGGSVVNDAGEVVIFVDGAAISISKAGLLRGRVVPEALILKKPTLRLIRFEDGHIGVNFAKDEHNSPADRPDQTALTTRILSFIAHPGTETEESSSLAALSRFQLQEAQIFMEDRMNGAAWSLPRVDAIFRSVEEGLAADLNVILPQGATQEEPGHLSGTLFFNWADKSTEIKARLRDFDTNPWVDKLPVFNVLKDQLLAFDADLELKLDEALNVVSTALNISEGHAALNIPDMSEDPVAIENLALELRYDGMEKALELSKAQGKLRDVDFEISAALNEQEEHITGQATLNIPTLPQDKIVGLWPVVLAKENARRWLVERMSTGTFTDVKTTMDIVVGKDEAGTYTPDFKNILAEFAFTEMDIDYRAPLRPVTSASGIGKLHYDRQTLDIEVNQATLGTMDIAKATLNFVDLFKKGAGDVDINIDLKGPLAQALSYVEAEPIAVKPSFAGGEIKGHADLAINVAFPTVTDIRMEDVKIAVTGTLSDIYLPNVVRGLPLQHGPLSIEVDPSAFRLKGTASLENYPVQLDYHEYLKPADKPYQSRTKALLVSDIALRTRFGIDFEDMLIGPVPVDVTYTELAGDTSGLKLHADLTSADLEISALNFKKPAHESGSLDLEGTLKQGDLQKLENIVLHTEHLNIEGGEIDFGLNNVMERGDFKSLTLDQTHVGVHFEELENGALKIVAKGPAVDLRPFIGEESEEDEEREAQPLELFIETAALEMGGHSPISTAKIYAAIDHKGAFNQLELDGRAGQGDIYLRYKPDDQGKRVFRFEADDAGATLRTLGLYDEIEGGQLRVYAEPIRWVYDRNLIGQAEITDFQVKEAPALARLLGALSAPGVKDLLGNEGLSFTKLEADFDWLYRPQGSLLVLKDGRSSGNSLGLTFDGTFDKAEGTVDVSGTIVPLSGINKVVSSVPVIGDILSGGTDSVFSATYTMKGEAEDPEVSVNPLSVLTPGILRRILFE